MIKNDKISVLITSHKSRFDSLDSVITSWLTQPIDELWIIDDGNGFKSNIKDERLLVFNMPKDFETKADYSVSTLTNGDLIIFADDDFLVKDNFVLTLYRQYEKDKDSIVGSFGELIGPTYERHNCRILFGKKIKRVIKADYLGIIFMVPRKYLGFDVRGMHKNCDDFWFCFKIHPEVNKYVVPNKDYDNLRCAINHTAMSKTKGLRNVRIDFYKDYYLARSKKEQIIKEKAEINEQKILLNKKNRIELKKKNKEALEIWNNAHNNNIK